MLKDMESMGELLLVLVPVIIIEIVLAVLALIGIYKMYGCRNGNKKIWTLIVVLIQIIGPIIYFLFGKGDGENNEDNT